MFLVCWNQFSQRLLDDLLVLVKAHLAFLSLNLGAVEDGRTLFLRTGESLLKYKESCQGITSVLSHLVSPSILLLIIMIIFELTRLARMEVTSCCSCS